MAIYKIYLTPQYQIEFSLTDREGSHYIQTMEIDSRDVIDCISLMQAAVDAVFEMAENQRLPAQFNSPGDSNSN